MITYTTVNKDGLGSSGPMTLEQAITFRDKARANGKEREIWLADYSELTHVIVIVRPVGDDEFEVLSPEIYEKTMLAVARELTALLKAADDRNPAAYVDNTGGGILCVIYPRANGSNWYFGTANTTWGGSFMGPDGEDLGEIEMTIDSLSTDAPAIAAEMFQKLSAFTDYDKRAKGARESAEEAFWAAVAEKFPEAKHGDLDPGEAMALQQAMESAIDAWIDSNVPKF